MPPVLIFAAGALGAVLAYRWLTAESAAARRLREEEAAARQAAQRAEPETLVRDPETGVYRPRNQIQ